MALPIERWAKQAVLLERKGDFAPVASTRVLADIADLKALEEATWRRRERDLFRSGVPLNVEGTYGALLAYPPAQTITTTSISGTVNLWPNLVYTPIPQNGVLAPQAYRVAIAWKVTTSTSPGNITFVPQINNTGTWTTGGTAVSGGSALGSSAAIALTASITNAFIYGYGDLTIRTAGTSSSIVGMFHLVSTQGTTGGLAGPGAVGTGFNLLLGGTGVTVDTQTTAQSLQMGATHTVTTITHNVEQIHWMDWN